MATQTSKQLYLSSHGCRPVAYVETITIRHSYFIWQKGHCYFQVIRDRARNGLSLRSAHVHFESFSCEWQVPTAWEINVKVVYYRTADWLCLPSFLWFFALQEPGGGHLTKAPTTWEAGQLKAESKDFIIALVNLAESPRSFACSNHCWVRGWEGVWGEGGYYTSWLNAILDNLQFTNCCLL